MKLSFIVPFMSLALGVMSTGCAAKLHIKDTTVGPGDQPLEEAEYTRDRYGDVEITRRHDSQLLKDECATAYQSSGIVPYQTYERCARGGYGIGGVNYSTQDPRYIPGGNAGVGRTNFVPMGPTSSASGYSTSDPKRMATHEEVQHVLDGVVHVQDDVDEIKNDGKKKSPKK